MSKKFSINQIIVVAIVCSIFTSSITYVVVRPNPHKLDPRCDPLFIKEVGSVQCEHSREQREWLRLKKDPNGS